MVKLDDFRIQLLSLANELLESKNHSQDVHQNLKAIYEKTQFSDDDANMLKVFLLDDKWVTVNVVVGHFDSLPKQFDIPLDRQFIELRRDSDNPENHWFVIIFCPKLKKCGVVHVCS